MRKAIFYGKTWQLTTRSNRSYWKLLRKEQRYATSTTISSASSMYPPAASGVQRWPPVNFAVRRYNSTSGTAKKNGGAVTNGVSLIPESNAEVIIVDPMHCIFLGINDPAVQSLRKPTEKTPRKQIQAYLRPIEMPSWVARLPNKVGLSAGGNLTSDEWKGMLLVFCPLICYPVAVADYEKAQKAWKKNNLLANVGSRPAPQVLRI
ncbi:hypothetical protein C8J57DRAFT_1214699 [Mycena rebaudengoi]|nr:hypothetical protein C8J57DRAFT_1214699 [Mycena rebaudengoi]